MAIYSKPILIELLVLLDKIYEQTPSLSACVSKNIENFGLINNIFILLLFYEFD